MKDSEVFGVGNIPKEWSVYKNKYIFKKKKEIVGENFREFTLLSLTTQGIKKKNIDDPNGKLPETFATYQKVTKDDLILCLFDLDISAVFSGKSDFLGMISPAYSVYECDELITADFAKLWFEMIGNDRKYLFYSKSLRNTINTENFNEIRTVIPPIKEQVKISKYLNEMISRINRIIDITNVSIDEYKKYRQSFITEIVTQGLNKNVKFKDSKIEWIGCVPENFNIVKFNRIARIASNLVHPTDYLEYLQVSPENIEKNSGKLLECRTVSQVGVISDNHLFYKGQILYSKVRPKLNKVTIAPFDGLCSADMYPIETTINSKYLMYYMLSDAFLTQVTMNDNRVKMPKINREELSKVMIVVPSEKEQVEIVNYLDNKCIEIDNIIEQKQKLLIEMEAYKKSLIYECVTGKREVK